MRITLCGSGRFEAQFKEWNERLTLAGHVVYTLSVYASFKDGVKDWFTDTQKATLDAVHKLKIENSDAILVLNVGGYIGESTRSEIDHAVNNSLYIFFLEEPQSHYDHLLRPRSSLGDWLTAQDLIDDDRRPELERLMARNHGSDIWRTLGSN